MQRIRAGIIDSSRAYLTVFNSTPLERKLAVLLGIPLNGCDPALGDLGTKSGSRKAMREAGVDVPDGVEDLRDSTDAAEALQELRGRRPDLQRAVLKLNDSFSGEGNAIVTFPASRSKGALRDALTRLEFSVPTETTEAYYEKYSRMGGVAEEFIEAPEKHSPSAQYRVSPRGEVLAVSTHDQILGGPREQVFLGCRFPARDDYRIQIQEAGRQVGQELARRGVVSRYGVDFLVHRRAPSDDWKVTALEINLRMGGTTHPYLALQFLTGGSLDPKCGLFRSPSGQTKYYKATDNLHSERYRGLLPEDLVDILTMNKLHYSHGTESGVLFHLIGALSEFGKLGLTAIANSHEQVDKLYSHTLEVLDAETTYGQ
jgi:hypothetical protein